LPPRATANPSQPPVIAVAAPVAASGQTLLQLSRAGVNFVDIYQARGLYLVPKGTVLGFEGVGTAPDGTRYAVVDQQGTVYAATGGVGWTLMQVIKASGARPIGIVSSEAKAQPLRERGYDVLVGDGKDQALVRNVVPNGVDVVFDANGADTWELTSRRRFSSRSCPTAER
jgi:NADPH:quinone reductase-like Zn-dependent oxidoreductase